MKIIKIHTCQGTIRVESPGAEHFKSLQTVWEYFKEFPGCFKVDTIFYKDNEGDLCKLHDKTFPAFLHYFRDVETVHLFYYIKNSTSKMLERYHNCSGMAYPMDICSSFNYCPFVNRGLPFGPGLSGKCHGRKSMDDPHSFNYHCRVNRNEPSYPLGDDSDDDHHHDDVSGRHKRKMLIRQKKLGLSPHAALFHMGRLGRMRRRWLMHGRHPHMAGPHHGGHHHHGFGGEDSDDSDETESSISFTDLEHHPPSGGSKSRNNNAAMQTDFHPHPHPHAVPHPHGHHGGKHNFHRR